MAVQIIDSLRRRRSIVLVSTALAGAALGVAGCGGDSETGASPSETASYVPAGSPFYLEATTDFDGPQWTQVDGLAKMFPAYPELRAELDQALRSDDVDFETEVRPLLGERAAIAGLDVPDAAALQGSLTAPDADGAAGAAAAAADAQEFVGVVEVADGKSDAMKALLVKSGATAAGEHDGAAVYTSGDDTVAAVTDDALVVSDTKQQVFSALDAHAAGGDKTLAGTSRFSDAIGKLPADVFGQAYFDVGGAVQKAGTSSPQLGQLGLSDYQNAVLAASIAAEPDGAPREGRPHRRPGLRRERVLAHPHREGARRRDRLHRLRRPLGHPDQRPRAGAGVPGRGGAQAVRGDRRPAARSCWASRSTTWRRSAPASTSVVVTSGSQGRRRRGLEPGGRRGQGDGHPRRAPRRPAAPCSAPSARAPRRPRRRRCPLPPA